MPTNQIQAAGRPIARSVRNAVRFLAMAALLIVGVVQYWESIPSARQPGVLHADIVEIRVSDHSGFFADLEDESERPPLYIASSLDGWDPASIRSVATWKAMDDRDTYNPHARHAGWIFHIPMELATDPEFRFKLTRGSWSSAELNANGFDIEPRALSIAEIDARPWQRRGDLMAATIELRLHGFIEQRGTRWPMGDAERHRIRGHTTTPPGTVEVHELKASPLDERRNVRVWLPECYHDPENAGRRYPVLYMHDAQNLFDAETDKFGLQWGVDAAITELVRRGIIEPWIVVGIDHGESQRVCELSPNILPIGEGHGRGSEYLAFLIDTVIPWVESNYRAQREAEGRALAGSSCGGNITILAMLERPGVFSRLLVESPAMRTGDGILIDMVARQPITLPDRLLIAMGTAEYGASDLDAMLIRRAKRLHESMLAHIPATLPAHERPDLELLIETGARHDEASWSARLPRTLGFLLAD